MSKMTDEQIKRALEFCKDNGILAENCDKCAYYKYGALCMDTMFENVLDLINRQQAETERLKEELEIRNQKRASIFEISNAYERGRTKAIKEFAERLKEKIYIKKDKGLYFEKIDNLVKEMVGEGK